jgi:hypothetical protein
MPTFKRYNEPHVFFMRPNRNIREFGIIEAMTSQPIHSNGTHYGLDEVWANVRLVHVENIVETQHANARVVGASMHAYHRTVVKHTPASREKALVWTFHCDRHVEDISRRECR